MESPRHVIMRRLRGLRYRRVHVGSGVRVHSRLIIRGPGLVVIGAHTTLGSRGAPPTVIQTCAPEAVVTFGRRCFINGAAITAHRSVSFGDDCLAGPGSHVMDADFHGVHPRERHQPVRVEPSHVTIGDNVWLAARAAVLKGSWIGDDAVIGYGTVVRGPVPAGSMVVSAANRMVRVFETETDDEAPGTATTHRQGPT